MPEVSVILPAFNAAEYIGEAMNSILRQTFRDFELIVIDDGSTDETLSILKRIAGTDSRIRLSSRKNRGYTRTLNEAIGLATGRFLARMDADDVALPLRFGRQRAYLESHPNCAAVGAWIQLIDPEGTPICCWRYPSHHSEIDEWHFGGRGNCMAHPAVMMRTDAVRQVGKYSPEMEPAEDFDLWLRLSDHHELGNVPEVLLNYRLHEKSQSHLRRHQQAERTAKAISDARKRRRIDNVATAVAEFSPWPEARRYWVKLALDAGEIANARRLAVKLVRRAPFSLSNWRTACAAMLGERAEPVLRILRRIGMAEAHAATTHPSQVTLL